MNLKVLPLEWWMEESDGDFVWCQSMRERYPQIEPVCFRDGYYLLGDECWFEHNGRAFKALAGDFKYDLELLEAEQALNHRHIAALKAVIDQRLATKSQKRLYWMALNAIQIRHIRRQAAKALMRINK